MPENQYKRYSVYDRKTDLPVVINGATSECMRVMGVSRTTFYCYVTHTRNGTRKCKYEIYEDEDDE